MSGQLNRHAYRKLVQEDIDWLLAQPRTLERDHIHAVLLASELHEYGLEDCSHDAVSTSLGFDACVKCLKPFRRSDA